MSVPADTGQDDPRSFRVAMFAETGARLQPTARDPAGAWHIDLTLDGIPVQVLLRDVIEEVDNIPIHLGIEIQVHTTAPDMDAAVGLALGTANLYCTVLSLASRSWIGGPEPQIAYETTPGIAGRAFRQWYRDVPVPTGKTSVPQELARAIHEGIHALPDADPHTFLIRMACEFYTGALREIEPVLRFMLLWPAAEALDDPLRRVMMQVSGDQRHWGLKALARQVGEDSQLIDDAYTLRSDLFHVNQGRRGAELIDDANQLGRRLEPLIANALCLVLATPDELRSQLPSGVTSAHPIAITLDAEIEGDPAAWGQDSHPQVAAEYHLRGQPTEGGFEVSFSPTFTVQNCDHLRGPSIAIHGPHGPNAGPMTFSSAKTIRDGVEQDVTPD